MKSISMVALSVMTLAFSFSFNAAAAKGAKGAKKAGPCEKDVASLCAGVEAGGGKIAKCLRDNKDKVSAECKAEWDHAKAAFKELKEVCHEDYQKFCSDSKPGRHAVMKCMKKNKKNLSEACKLEFKDMKEKRKARRGK